MLSSDEYRIMRFIKCIAVEYLLWLYCIACMAWIAFRVGGLEVSPNMLVILPLVPALLIAYFSLGMGALISGFSHLHPYKFKLWKSELTFLILLSLVMGWMIVEVKPIAFFTQAENTLGILSGIFNPNPAQLVPMLQALVETIFLALLATVFAIPFAFLLSFFAAQNLMFGSVIGKMVYLLIRTISTIFRSIEAIVWAIIFCVWVGIGPFAGMLALWIHSIASLIKLYSEQIENIDQGPVEAIKATGASTLQVWKYAVVPQILAPYLAFTIYRWDINVRMATIVGFVGGGGIGLALYQQQQMLSWRNVGLIMWLIAIAVWVMDMFSAYIRDKLLVK